MKRGSTLIELMLVFAFIVILATLLIPIIVSTQRSSVLVKYDEKIENGHEYYVTYKSSVWKVSDITSGKSLILVNGEKTVTIDIKKDREAFLNVFEDMTECKTKKPDTFLNGTLDSGPETSILRFKVGDKVDHKLKPRWGSGIVLRIENGTYTARFSVGDDLKVIKGLTDIELEAGF